MPGFRAVACSICVSLFLASGPALVAGPTGGDDRTPIAVSSLAHEPDRVATWDPRSPQRLVRIEDELYQEDAGTYFPVIDDRITVRLSDEVPDWDALVRRAEIAAPSTFAALDQLVPARTNRLGIVDLVLPDGDPTLWADLVFRTGLVRYAEVVTRGAYHASPDDPQYPSQWALNNTGQTGGSSGADLRAESAWDITAGSPSVVVAVLDSGTSVDHPDLAPNVWHNAGETPNNSVDDDGNGFVDDWEGWDFGSGNNDPRSNNFHGTHVTGIVNAAGGNGIGVAGLAGGLGGPGVQAMALGVGEGGPIGSILDDAILYAADNGAHVITMSLSVGVSTAINDALAYAYDTKDVFIDCAAGNNGPSVSFPANRAEVMAVASTDHNDNHSSFSNTGPEVEVAAPGSNILSTQLGNGYGTSSGTSFSAPYVAALAGLIRSVNPGLPAADVRQLIIDSADDVAAPGFDDQTGHGRINAFQALSMAAVSDGSIALDSGRYACSGELTVTVSDFDLAGTGTVGVMLRSGAEPAGEPAMLIETATGSGSFRGTLLIAAAPAAADGALQLDHDDTVTAEYVDADDGAGGTDVMKTAVATTDCAGPGMSAPSAVEIDDGSARVEWTTDESATALVRFGSVPPPTQESSTGGLLNAQSVLLSGLDACTVYKYELQSADDLGNVSIDDNGGAYYTFETFGNFPGLGVGPCHQGRASLDRESYDCLDTVQVSVTDVDLGTDPGQVETVQVLLTSTSEPSGEWVTLTEDGPDSSRFDGTAGLSEVAPGPDGVVTVSAADLITVTYYDEDDGTGSPRIDSFVSVADCRAPAIRDVQVTAISSTRAEITWTTDEPATSKVEYGPTVSLGQSVESTDLITSHNVAISAFDACDRVFFRVTSADANGDTLAGQPYEFNVKQIGGVVFHDNFETDLGWTLPGEWDRGPSLGLGSGTGDPTSAYSGNMVLGNDLAGEGPFPGDYEPLARELSRSPVIDASGASNLELILHRKLGVAGGDTASIAIFTPGEQPVWSNTGETSDPNWIEVRYDVSAAADGQSSVRIALGMESGGPGQSFGWNVDEMILKDANEPDYLVCGGCAGAPSFAGVAAVYDPDPCGASGLTLEWDAAPAWGTGGGGTYDVYRGTAPDFTPDAANRIATAVAATTWIDATAPADTAVWYVVRARNDESCAGGEGATDANLVRLTSMDTLTQPLPASVGSSVLVDAVGDAHVRLSWDAAAGADRYVVRRSSSVAFDAAVEIGSTPETFLEDIDAALAGSTYSYRVFAVDACGRETP